MSSTDYTPSTYLTSGNENESSSWVPSVLTESGTALPFVDENDNDQILDTQNDDNKEEVIEFYDDTEAENNNNNSIAPANEDTSGNNPTSEDIIESTIDLTQVSTTINNETLQNDSDKMIINNIDNNENDSLSEILADGNKTIIRNNSSSSGNKSGDISQDESPPEES